MRSVSGGKRGDGKDGPSLPGRPKRAKQGPGAAAKRPALGGTGLLGWLATAAPRGLVVPYSTSATLARRTFVALRCGEPFLRMPAPGQLARSLPLHGQRDALFGERGRKPSAAPQQQNESCCGSKRERGRPLPAGPAGDFGNRLGVRRGIRMGLPARP